MKIHELINTAFAQSATFGECSLRKFAENEQIEDYTHAAEMSKEIIVLKDISDSEEIDALTKLFRFVTTAPYGESLSRAKVNEKGEYQYGIDH